MTRLILTIALVYALFFLNDGALFSWLVDLGAQRFTETVFNSVGQ